MTDKRFTLFVPGTPVPQGSMIAMRPANRPGAPTLLKHTPGVMSWRAKVTTWASEAMGDQPPLEGPIGARLDFVVPRPQGHWGTGRNAEMLRRGAPVHPATMPDLDKLVRAVFDALTDARVWRDDGQVVWVQAMKVYGPSPGVHITLGRMLR